MNIGRGMSAQWALPVSNEYIGRMDALERAADETKHTRTIETQIRLAKAEPRKPPETLDELKRGLGTFAALIHLFYGEHCDHYKKCWTMLEVLYSPQVYFAEQAYTPEMIKSYWFEVLDSGRGFFFTALGEEEFQRPGGPAFPGSMLNTVLPCIKSTTKVENGLFPIKWMGTSTQTKTTPGSSGGGAALPPPPSFTPPKPDGNPPPFNNITSHCHPIVKREFGAFHERFNNKLSVPQLCHHSNVEPKDLYFQNNFKKSDGTNTMCYHHVLCQCMVSGCKLKHPAAGELLDAFLEALCKQLKPGRDHVMKTAGGKKRRGGR